MKNYRETKKMWPTLGFALGAVISFSVLLLVATGDVGRVVGFRGIWDEIAFVTFVGIIATIFLSSAISQIFRER